MPSLFLLSIKPLQNTPMPLRGFSFPRRFRIMLSLFPLETQPLQSTWILLKGFFVMKSLLV